MNSSRLRIAIDAPKLAITMAMALPRRRSRLNKSQSRASAIDPVRSAAMIAARMSIQPKESAPIGAMVPVSVPASPEMISAR